MKPLLLQIPLAVLSERLHVGDIVTLRGKGWLRDIRMEFTIPETRLFEIVCPELIPEGAD